MDGARKGFQALMEQGPNRAEHSPGRPGRTEAAAIRRSDVPASAGEGRVTVHTRLRRHNRPAG